MDRMVRGRDGDCLARIRSESDRNGYLCCSREPGGSRRRERARASHWRRGPEGPGVGRAGALVFGVCQCPTIFPGAVHVVRGREGQELTRKKQRLRADAPLSSLTPKGLSRRLELLVANGFDWIEPRRLDRGIDAENQTDRNGNQECQKNRADGHNGGPSSEPCDDLGHHKAKEDSQQATSKRNQRGFDDKLTDDVPPPGADGTANTNLTSALEN